MSEKEKLKEYLRIKGITKHAFCKSLGFSDRFLDSGQSLGVDKLRQIKLQYPDLNLEWVVLGKGSMIDYQHQRLSTVLDRSHQQDHATTTFIFKQMKYLAELKKTMTEEQDTELIRTLYNTVDLLMEKLVQLSGQNTELVDFIRKEYGFKSP